MAPFRCPPPGCYPAVTNTWELTNQWTGRSTLVHSSRLQPPQWSQEVWDNVMLHTGVPPYALEEFHRVNRPVGRPICGGNNAGGRNRGREPIKQTNRQKSWSKSRGRNHDIDRIHEGEYKEHVPSKQDFTVKQVQKEPSQKELKSILKHQDSRMFFDDVRGPYHGFNTFSEHPVMYKGFRYPTAEHLLMFFKVRPPLVPACHHERCLTRSISSSRNGLTSAVTSVSNQRSPNSTRQQNSSRTRNRPSGNKRSTIMYALSCSSFRGIVTYARHRWKWHSGTSSPSTAASRSCFSRPGSDQ